MKKKVAKRTARPSPHAIAWPPGYHLYVYEEIDGGLDDIENTTDRKYNLNDNLFQLDTDRTLLLGIEIDNPRWPVWDEETIKWIEERIKWDLEFDGNVTTVLRYSPEIIGKRCAEEFIWKVTARNA